MGTLLITGGAGFIGSNLVQHASRPHRRSHGRRRQADLRGQPAEPRAAARRSARHVRAGRHRRSRRDGAACSPSIGRDAVLNLAAETHVDRSIDGPRPFIDTNIVGTFVLLEARARFIAGAAGGGARRVPLPARLDRRGLRHARRRRAVQRGDAVRAELAVRGEQGGGRSSGARLPPHLRPAGADHELLEQLRAVPVSREADPADDPERARGPAAADLRRRRQRARLAARRGSLRRPAAGAREGARRREVQRRRRQRADQPRGRRSHLRRARRAAAGGVEPGAARARAIARSRRSCPIAPATTGATPSTRRRSAASSAGRRATRSRTGLRATVRWYLEHRDWCERSRPGATIASGSGWASNDITITIAFDSIDRAEGDHPRRRLGIAAASADARGQQAAAADLQQADGLLPAVDADAGGHPRRSWSSPRRTSRTASGGCSATAASSGCGSSTPRSRSPTAWRRRSSSAASSSARDRVALALGDNIFYGAHFSDYLRSAAARETRRDGVRLPGARSRALRRRRVRRRRPRGQPRGEAGEAEVVVRRDRPVLLRQPGARHRGAA